MKETHSSFNPITCAPIGLLIHQHLHPTRERRWDVLAVLQLLHTKLAVVRQQLNNPWIFHLQRLLACWQDITPWSHRHCRFFVWVKSFDTKNGFSKCSIQNLNLLSGQNMSCFWQKVSIKNPWETHLASASSSFNLSKKSHLPKELRFQTHGISASSSSFRRIPVSAFGESEWDKESIVLLHPFIVFFGKLSIFKKSKNKTFPPWLLEKTIKSTLHSEATSESHVLCGSDPSRGSTRNITTLSFMYSHGSNLLTWRIEWEVSLDTKT